LKVAFPTLQVEKLDIKKVAVMRMNEALSDRFNVPSKVRLVTPAIFAGGGFLIKKEISFSRLGELLSRSSVVPLESWHTVSEEDLQKAEEAIGGRYAAMGMGLVVLAGLLDGVNPCAFATIIFLLSYLQVTQRKPREILQVGLAFISAVFLAYFILGFGLVEVISRMSVLQHFGKIVTWLMALMALVVMAFSLRDGILCMRGQMGDMTLQLPEFLKKRIHTVIRKGSRHSHFVVAAFVAGIVISFLELACTGQVYAPTILFMLKTGKDTLGAVSYLLVYNVAFVLPLIFIFGLAYGGLKSGTLTDFMRKHAAMVKFCTAILFFFLFIFLIFGNKIMTILH
jgi:cytochrome c biogenesis protein CcdA